jgi:hypothetical protein
MAVFAIFRIRRDTAANWTSVNPVLKLGEPGLETNTRRVKYGDGVTAWNALAYSVADPSDPDLVAIAALVSAADKLPYATGAGTWALANFTAAGRALVDDADAAAQRVTLGLGTIAQQAATSVAITGGSITGLATFSVGDDTGLKGLTVNAGGAANQGSYFQGRKAASPSWLLGDASATYGGTTAGFALYAYSGPIILHGSATRPDNDGAMALGDASYRFSTVYAASGTINTSDKRDKRDIGEIPDAWLDAWAGVEWSRYKFKDGERWHVGLVAQQVRDAFAAHGLDAREIGLLCYDEWPAVRAVRAKHDRNGNLVREAQPGRKAGNRWGLRYDECQALEAAYVRRELKRLAAR